MKQRTLVHVVILALVCVFTMGDTLLAGSESVRAPVAGPFYFITEGQVWDYDLVVKDSWFFESNDNAKSELEKIMLAWPIDKMATLHVNDYDRKDKLRDWAPLVDQVIINPFLNNSQQEAEGEDLIWPHFNQPIINKIRAVRKSYSKRLLAEDDLTGDWTMFKNRSSSFEEFKWRVLALIGAN